MRKFRPFSRLDSKASGILQVVKVSGLYNQRVIVSFKDAKGKLRRNHAHASQLVRVSDPYPEATLLDVNNQVSEGSGEGGEDSLPRPWQIPYKATRLCHG